MYNLISSIIWEVQEQKKLIWTIEYYIEDSRSDGIIDKIY
jgi:hypothetical protein